MIIDEILDRKYDDENGYQDNYNAKDFYDYIREEEEIFKFDAHISYAMDSLENKDVQKALCEYITENGYNEKICDYVNKKNWL